MRVVVIKKFKDKYTQQIYQEGAVLDNISKERFEEINSVGDFLEPLYDFSKMKIAELRNIAIKKGIAGASEMKKEDLVKELQK